MRVVLQRVSKANVAFEGEQKAEIGFGLVALVGFESSDNIHDIMWMTQKILNLRIFADQNQLMNKSLVEVEGEILVISQFTLHAKTKKGARPSFIKAAQPIEAKKLYELFLNELEKNCNEKIKTGKFGAMMDVSLTNSGPVTIIIDSKNKE